MKKRILFLALALTLTLLLIPVATASDPVITFPDPNFEAAVREIIRKPAGDILASDVAGITELILGGREIADLTGIAHFTALTWLQVNNNQLTALDMSRNPALASLWADYNQLAALDVSQNTALTSLGVSSNQLTALDVRRNPALVSLWAGNNQLTALDVTQNTALESLGVWDNQLTALDLSRNTALANLWAGGNQLTALDLSRNTALASLGAGSNQLAALDVTHNTALLYLEADHNQLTTLDVSQNTALISLGLDSNQLTALDLSHNPALASLWADNNQLTELDVTQNTALARLAISGNQLTALDVSRNPALADLSVRHNRMGQDPAVSVPAWTKSPALNGETYDGDWQTPLFFYFPQGNPPSGTQATPYPNVGVTLDGEKVPVQVYGISGNIYLRLSDLAIAVGIYAYWDGAVYLDTSRPAGSSTPGAMPSGPVEATPYPNVKVYLNGTEIPVNVYGIDGSTILSLGNAAAALGLTANWENETAVLTRPGS
ncbi:MAG: hypothetical protein FWG93_01175 [Oscillospiraceae bacterium]|nr:hypothetical protein [Oscillospiraceae bacterium]